MSNPKIVGLCPACGQSGLALDVVQAGIPSRVVCETDGCPQPDAVHQLLAVSRTDHTVEITEDGYTLKHPTLERVTDQLFTCPATAWMSQLIRNTEPEPGWYRMTGGGHTWNLTPLDGAGS